MKTEASPGKFLAAVLVLALWMASGCANKNNVENEQSDSFAENSAENPEGSTEQKPDGDAAEKTAEGTDTAATEAELFGEEKKADDTTKTAQNDPAMDGLFDPSAQDPNASGDPNFDELTGKAASTTPPADPNSATTASADPNAAGTTSPLPTDPAASADPLASNETKSLTDPATPSNAQAFSDSASFSGKSAAAYAGAVLPTIPDRAVSKKGANLNRYYFLRNGDTPKKVSQLIYGDKGHASSLKKWNKGRWIPGKVVYYNSPSQPNDDQMISLYDERGLTAEQHKVGPGETMSSIAKKSLGSLSSWKELAVVNGLNSPDTLKKGQTIKLFPNLGAASETASAGSSEGAPSPTSSPSPTPDPIPSQPPAQMAQTQPGAPDVSNMVPPQPDPMADDLNKPKRKTKKEGLNLGKVLSQNSFTLAMGLGIGLLLLSLMMINKRKRGGAEEFGEDAFAAPKKKRR